MPYVEEVDVNDEFDWAERTTHDYVLYGTEYRVQNTIFDDGHLERAEYQNGVLRSLDVSDPTNALPIETSLTRYDAAGVMTRSNVLDDAGLRRDASYTAGVITEETFTDEGNALGWDSVVISYRDGALYSFDITFDADNGFASGAETESTASSFRDIHYDSEGTEDWMFRVFAHSGYDNWTTTFYDDGGQSYELYRSGVIWSVEHWDYGHSEDWAYIRESYNSEGVLQSRVTEGDDFSHFIESYTDGQLTMTRLQDDGQVHDFRAIETFYDEFGVAVWRETTNDRGQVTTEDLRASRLRFDEDDSAPWESIQMIWNSDGSRAEREIVYDDGRVVVDSFAQNEVISSLRTNVNGDTRLNEFEGGRRVAAEFTDVTGSQAWETSRFEYGVDGQVDLHRFVFDNGVQRETIYDDSGQIILQIEDDMRDQFQWSSAVNSYEGGELVERELMMENGDIQIDLFVEGARATRLRIDNDASHYWQVQVQDFGEGGVTTTNFASFSDLPDPLSWVADRFGDDEFGGMGGGLIIGEMPM